jgi:hypothetical protein
VSNLLIIKLKHIVHVELEHRGIVTQEAACGNIIRQLVEILRFQRFQKGAFDAG